MDHKTLKQLETLIQKLLDKALINVATKDDLKDFATKNDLDVLENRLHAKIKYDVDNAVVQIAGIVNKRKADRTDIEALDKRVTLIERKLTT